MLIKYTGGRSIYTVTVGRVKYHWTEENNKTLDITDNRVIKRIFNLPNRSRFEIVEIKEKPIENPVEAVEAEKKVISAKKSGKPKKEKK